MPHQGSLEPESRLGRPGRSLGPESRLGRPGRSLGPGSRLGLNRCSDTSALAGTGKSCWAT